MIESKDLTNKMPLSKAQWLCVIALVVIALNLRPALAAIGPLLQSIQLDLGLNYAMASLLTTLPVLAMGLFSFVGFQLAKPLGLERSIAAALSLLAAATAARFWAPSGGFLITTALLAGIAIALIQTLMPAIIKQRFGLRAPLVMGFYVTAIMGGAALAATSAPMLASTLSWRDSLGHWVWLALFATLLCLLWVRPQRVTQPNHAQPTLATQRFWRSSRAWQLAVFFALGTSCYVSVLAWLAPYAQELGYSAKQAGLLLGFLTLCEVVAGIAFPWWASRRHDKRPVIAVLCALQLIGFSALALIPETGLLLWVAMVGLGIGGIFPLSMIITMDHIDNPLQAGRLTAFVQGIGYLIAAVAPFAAGYMRDALESFTAAWLALAATSIVALILAARFSVQSYRQHFPAPSVEATTRTH
ncbi:MFS transporter [Aliidiomarina maris]|uniref:MFS transporter n=1 Tax=Aliidiomarina maris TaxID=531312 RepID=A0A327WQN6_9GAMM|nr:MFS transporter [Aliidiomarina maris]RAJ94865.1 CP family cyanate transporter-like MFS transporter [Aliidiomarina maris]RUO20532.1 MFS transporter [Aliidiomarina maris]